MGPKERPPVGHGIKTTLKDTLITVIDVYGGRIIKKCFCLKLVLI